VLQFLNQRIALTSGILPEFIQQTSFIPGRNKSKTGKPKCDQWRVLRRCILTMPFIYNNKMPLVMVTSTLSTIPLQKLYS